MIYLPSPYLEGDLRFDESWNLLRAREEATKPLDPAAIAKAIIVALLLLRLRIQQQYEQSRRPGYRRLLKFFKPAIEA
jgi:hypothetical protein